MIEWKKVIIRSSIGSVGLIGLVFIDIRLLVSAEYMIYDEIFIDELTFR